MKLALVSDTHLTPRAAAFGDNCIPDVIQERIGQKIVGAVTLELTDGGHHFEVVTLDGLVRHSILDHPGVYPALAGIASQPLPAGTADPQAPPDTRPAPA